MCDHVLGRATRLQFRKERNIRPADNNFLMIYCGWQLCSRKVLSPAVCTDCLTNAIEMLVMTFVLHRGRVSGVCCQGRCCRGQWKCDGTRAETRFRLSAKRTSPFKSAGESVQSTTGSRGVRISGNNAGYTMFRGSVKGTGYPLHSSVSPSLPTPVCHPVPSHFNWSLHFFFTSHPVAY